MKIKMISLASLLLLSTSSQAVLVNFSGTIDAFNSGPFTAGDLFTGSFTMDESVVPTGNNIATFDGAMDDFTLEVTDSSGSSVIAMLSGQDGRIQQFSGANGNTDFFVANIGGPFGSVSGSVGANVFERFTVDWRGANLFDDPTVLATNLDTADFNYRRVTIRFDNAGNPNNTIDNAGMITFGPTSAVPVPAAVWLFGSGLLGLTGIARRKKG